MIGEFLTQDEVDSILRSVTGEDNLSLANDLDDAGVKPYNIAQQERIVRGRMPTLEIINERFARLLRIGLFEFMRKNPEVSVGSVKVIKYNDFIRNLAVPTNLNIIALKPLRGNALIIFEPSLIFSIVDSIFGGDGRTQVDMETREFSATEQRVIARMLEVVFAEYAKAWAPVFQLSPEYVRSEMHTQFANIANPAEIVVSSSFEVELGSTTGSIHICLLYSSLEPIRDVLSSTVQGDQGEPDRRWTKMLKAQVQQADVEMSVTLADVELCIGDVLSLRAGDIIPITLPETVKAQVDGVEIFDCSYGVSTGQYAVKIENVRDKSYQEKSIADQTKNKPFKDLSGVAQVLNSEQ